MIVEIEKMAKIGRVFSLVTAVLLGVFGLTVAGSSPVSIEQLYRHQTMYSNGKLLQFSHDSGQEVSPTIPEKGQKQKSVAMAAGLSFLVPGAGQFYVGEKARAVPFFLADVAGWATYFGFRSQGKKREREYRSFADAHYDPQKYFTFLDTALGVDTTANGIPSDYNPVGRDYCRKDSIVNLCVDSGFIFSHHIPSKEGGSLERNFEYYENLGKYDQFFAGWDDADLSRRTYLDMRSKANSSFSKSKIGGAISLVARLAAAVDAALGAKRFNKKIGQTKELEIGFKMTRYNGARMPKLLATYKF